jgi:hypothetical protein
MQRTSKEKEMQPSREALERINKLLEGKIFPGGNCFIRAADLRVDVGTETDRRGSLRIQILSVRDLGFEKVRVIVRNQSSLYRIEYLEMSSTRRYEYFKVIPVDNLGDETYTVELVAD